MNEFEDDRDNKNENNNNEMIIILRCNPENPIMSQIYVSSSGYINFSSIFYRIPTDVLFYEKHVILPTEIIPNTDFYMYFRYILIKNSSRVDNSYIVINCENLRYILQFLMQLNRDLNNRLICLNYLLLGEHEHNTECLTFGCFANDENITTDNCFELLIKAYEMNVISLIRECEKFMINNININNLLQTIEYSISTHNFDILYLCYLFILQYII